MVIVVPIVVVAVVASLAMARGYSRRPSRDEPAAHLPSTDFDERLERVARSVDVIAVELERISESQRFLSKILANPKQSDSSASDG